VGLLVVVEVRGDPDALARDRAGSSARVGISYHGAVPDIRLPPPPGVDVLDVELFGTANLSCSYLLHATEPVLIETGPATVFPTVRAHLDRLRVEPRHVVLTHIHLDHGGGVGHVADLFGGATIWVHDIGAPHVVDPTRLVASARRLFGDALDTLYGEPIPVPDERIRVMAEGTVIPLGDRELRVLYTPGHARHEVTLYEADSGAAFVGDTAGVCYGEGWQKPATPPPEFDLDAALDSIARVQQLRPKTICFTHFGTGSEAVLDEAASDLRRWDAILRPLVERGATDDEMLAALEPGVGEPPGTDAFVASATELSSTRNSMLGYARYYRKQIEARG
jgi:glyoxylase-like metal-dependent hydrolase (beta-lactamase superfamily II)